MPETDFKLALDEYYEIRGWDKGGRPTVEKLKALGIEDEIIDQYQKARSESDS
jgi:aldehyde:ferredoxin oxidoreductase